MMQQHGTSVLDRRALLREHAELLEELRHAAPSTSQHERLGFLRACMLEQPLAKTSEQVEAAAGRLRATAEWRANVGIDAAMADSSLIKAERSHRNLLRYDFLGHDRHGRPVMVERVGAWDVQRIAEMAASDPERFVLLHCMAVETMVRMERPADCIDERGQVAIMDCSGLGMQHLNSGLVRAMQVISQIDSDHYPDTLAELWVVNAPAIFSAITALCRPFLSSDTLQKFHVSYGVPPELANLVGSKVLPVELGGERILCFPYDCNAPLFEF